MAPNSIVSRRPALAFRAFAILVAAAAMVSGTSAEPAAPAKPNAAQPPAGPAAAPAVGVITLEGKSVPFVKKLPGRVKSVRVAQVRARVPGVLLKQIFREGADVKEGDLLFQIDPKLFEARVASASAAVASAEATVAVAAAAQYNAYLQAKRFRELIDTKAISKQELDNAESAERQAAANKAAADAGVLAAKAALAAAQLDLDYTKVVAPISGRIGRPFVTEGALVGQGEVTPLAEINQLDPVYVDFSIPANELASLQQKAGSATTWDKQISVTLLLDNGTAYKSPGKLLLSEIVVDPGTASVKIRSEFPNTACLFWPEMYVWGNFALDDGKKAVLVPQQAVIRTAEATFVYVVGDDNKLVVAPVETRETEGANWVIRDHPQLRDGVKLVVDGNQRAQVQLKPGATVTPIPWAPNNNTGRSGFVPSQPKK